MRWLMSNQAITLIYVPVCVNAQWCTPASTHNVWYWVFFVILVHLVFCGAGSVLLVINIERSPLPSSLRDVLMNQFMTDESEDLLINIAGRSVAYHKDFRLLLSSSVPLFVRGIYSYLVRNVINIHVYLSLGQKYKHSYKKC